VKGDSRGTPAATSACIDAETLAAWADGGLDKAHAAAVELHLADCDRCTAMLATFARTLPEAQVVGSLWKRWHLRWLVPVATAATVAALWVLVPRPESPSIASLKPPTTESEATAAASTPAAAPTQPSEQQERETRAAQTRSAPTDTFAKREAPPQRAPDADARSDDAKRLPPSSLNETIALAPPQQAGEAARADRAEEKRVDENRADARTERFAPPVPAAGAAAAAAPPAATAPAPAAPRATASQESDRARTLASGARSVTAAPLFEILSPDPATRWRVVGTGQVERSTTRGAQWERATLPESVTLTGGASPSPSICWLVGRSGAIYVTTDGLRFMKVPFIDRSDFVSIQATDARRATVVTIDGRTMRTDDQGAIWTRVLP
jgi:hypothetical protein